MSRQILSSSATLLRRASASPLVYSRGAAAFLSSASCDVVLVGCGVPGRGMGWYHAKQLLDGDVPSGRLTDVVEPWFLGSGANSAAGAEFASFKEDNAGVNFHSTLDTLEGGSPKLAIISGRTADNPALLRKVIDRGCTHIFLEKPGAPSVGELEDMAAYAKEMGVGVFMGCEYVFPWWQLTITLGL